MRTPLSQIFRPQKQSTDPLCELCASPLDEPHGHSVDTSDHRLLCICYACTVLFSAPGAARGRFKIVPKRYRAIKAPLFNDAQWDALGIPIGLAFFFEDGSAHHVTAFYPGPAGATQSELPLDAWNELRDREPAIAQMLPDVEGALVYRPKDGPAQAFVVPIDACYELTGLVRSRWQGIDGGDAVRAGIDTFFERVRALAEEDAAP